MSSQKLEEEPSSPQACTTHEIWQFIAKLRKERDNKDIKIKMTVGLSKFKMVHVEETPLQSHFIQYRHNLEEKLINMKESGMDFPFDQKELIIWKCINVGLYAFAQEFSNSHNYVTSRSQQYIKLALEEYDSLNEAELICLFVPCIKQLTTSDKISVTAVSTMFDTYFWGIGNNLSAPRTICGYFMIFCQNITFKFLQDISINNLKKMLASLARNTGITVNVGALAKKMKSWTLTDIKQQGKRYFLTGISGNPWPKQSMRPIINYCR